MRRLPLRWILLLILSVVLIMIGASFLGRALVNHFFVMASESSESADPADNSGSDGSSAPVDAEKMLLVDNFPEGEIPCYNLGNEAFKQGDYNGAIYYYSQALSKNTDEEKDCDIRINYALSLVNTPDYEHLETTNDYEQALYVSEELVSLTVSMKEVLR